MREAFKVLQNISEEDKAYHIYQSRLDAQREAATIQHELEESHEARVGPVRFAYHRFDERLRCDHGIR